MTLVFWFAPGSSSMAPHIALHEVGAEFEPRPISFARKQQRDPAYLAINPEGKVPTLVIDGRPLTEVAGILFWLAKRFPEAKLLPRSGDAAADIEAEAQAVSWMSFIAATIHPARRQGFDRCRVVFALADRRLGSREWALGSHSIVDIHLFRLFWRFWNQFKPLAEEFPNLSAHYTRMMARPAVRRTIEAETKVGYELP